MNISLKVLTNCDPYINTIQVALPEGGGVLTIDRDETAWNSEEIFGVDKSKDYTGFVAEFHEKVTEELHEATIEFDSCYLWALNGYNIFGPEGMHPVVVNKLGNAPGLNQDFWYEEELVNLIKNGTATLELEDDAPEGYVCKLLSWEVSV